MRKFIIIIICLFLGITSEVFALTSKPNGKNVRIGVILFSEDFRETYTGLKEGLEDLDYINLRFDIENIEGDLSKIPDILERFSKRNIDIIMATTTPVNQRIFKYNDKYGFNVLFTVVAEPVSSGLVNSMQHPGKNFTGVSHLSFRLLPKRFEIFTEVFPFRDKIICLVDSEDTFAENQFEYLRPFRQRYPAKEIIKVSVTRDANLKHVLDELQLKNPGQYGIVMMPHALFVDKFDILQNYAFSHKIPIMVIDSYLLEKGGALGYSAEFYDVGYQLAVQAAGIIEGRSASDIPVQLPNKVELAVNKKILKKMGIRYNEKYLSYANRVVNE